MRALRVVAESKTDTRRAAAYMELAICNTGDISELTASNYEADSSSDTIYYLLKSAELGDTWARAIVHRVF